MIRPDLRLVKEDEEKHDDDVGGGFVEPRPRKDPLGDWEEPANRPIECSIPTKKVGTRS